MTEQEFIDKWKWQSSPQFGSALFDCSKDLLDDLRKLQTPRSVNVDQRVSPMLAEWISVKKRLPEVGIYLVVAETEPLVAFWYGDVWLSSEGGEKINVSHWMPLPEPPKQ